MKHTELKQLIKEEISKVLELRTIDYKPKDDLVHLYLMTYSDKVGEPYFERKYKKFRNDVESLLQSFDAAVENDHGISDKNLKILVNRKDKIKVKNILTKLSNRYGFESELEIDTLEEIHSSINENKFEQAKREIEQTDFNDFFLQPASFRIPPKEKSMIISQLKKRVVEKLPTLISLFPDLVSGSTLYNLKSNIGGQLTYGITLGNLGPFIVGDYLIIDNDVAKRRFNKKLSDLN